MSQPAPKPISKSERMARQRRIAQIARRLGFVGRVEYRHVHSQTGGGQYGQAAAAEQDLLTVYAKAFERDANPDDFSLEAIIAHECGHQLLARHERLTRNLPSEWSEVTEEIVASLLGSLLVTAEKDQQDLVLKAMFQTNMQNLESYDATLFLMELRAQLEDVL